MSGAARGRASRPGWARRGEGNAVRPALPLPRVNDLLWAGLSGGPARQLLARSHDLTRRARSHARLNKKERGVLQSLAVTRSPRCSARAAALPAAA